MEHQEKRLADRELCALFDRLFPYGFAGADVLAEVAPEGWEHSPLLACLHPSIEQIFDERLAIHRNVSQLDRLRRHSDGSAFEPRPEPTLEDVRREYAPSPVKVEEEVIPIRVVSARSIASVETLDQFRALASADRAALGSDRWSPDAATFHAGYERLCATHPELSRLDLPRSARLLCLGTRLWREGRRDREVDDDQNATDTDRGVTAWTPELVQVSLEWLALRAALVRRRAMWLTRLVDASVMWREPGVARARLMVIERGEILLSTDAHADRTPPIPPGYQRPVMARRELFTVAGFDRLRVMTTELKRLIAAGGPVALRFGIASALADTRLAAARWWV